MRCIAQCIVELKCERCEPFVLVNIGFDNLAAYADQFRLHPCSRFAESGEHDSAELISFLGFADALIFITIQRRVCIDAVRFLQRV